MPENASALTYSLGFVMATGLLHAFGIAIGVINRWPLGRHALRGAGALVALGGIFFPGSRVDLMRSKLTLLLSLLPSAASAHLVDSGFGDFYDGALHLIVTPGDLLIVIGIALLGGLQGSAIARTMLVSLFAGCLVGALISFVLPATLSLDRVVVVAFGLLGVLVLIDRHMPRTAIIVFAVAVGVAQGLSAVPIREQTTSWIWLAGSVTLLAIIATLLAALVVAARAPWMRIAGAVGSWLQRSAC